MFRRPGDQVIIKEHTLAARRMLIIRTPFLINTSVGKKLSRITSAKMKAMIKSTFDIKKNTFETCKMRFTWSIHEGYVWPSKSKILESPSKAPIGV